MRLVRELTANPEAVALARHALDDLESALPDGRLLDVQLLVSELVTNAVRHADLHAGDMIRLVVELADRWGVLSDDATLVWFELDRPAAAA